MKSPRSEHPRKWPNSRPAVPGGRRGPFGPAFTELSRSSSLTRARVDFDTQLPSYPLPAGTAGGPATWMRPTSGALEEAVGAPTCGGTTLPYDQNGKREDPGATARTPAEGGPGTERFHSPGIAGEAGTTGLRGMEAHDSTRAQVGQAAGARPPRASAVVGRGSPPPRTQGTPGALDMRTFLDSKTGQAHVPSARVASHIAVHDRGRRSACLLKRVDGVALPNAGATPVRTKYCPANGVTLRTLHTAAASGCTVTRE